eukprot:g345.t1
MSFQVDESSATRSYLDLPSLLSIITNACRMLKARDFHVLDGWDNLSNEDDLKKRLEGRNLLTVDAIAVGSGEKLRIFFPKEEKFNIRVLRAYCEKMEKEELRRGIFLLPGKTTLRTRSAMKEVAPTFLLEAFYQWEFLVDIMDHYLVPKHILLTEGEKQNMLERCRVNETQLPRIKEDDPIARYLGLKPGNAYDAGSLSEMNSILRETHRGRLDRLGDGLEQSVCIGGSVVRLVERPGEAVGTVIWRQSANLLSQFLVSGRSSLKNRRVIELGAGTGICGLFAALQGAHVVITDREESLDLIRLNINLNLKAIEAAGGTCICQKLDWNTWKKPDSFTEYDYIFASDVVYSKAVVDPLIRVLNSLCNDTNKCILAYKLRDEIAEVRFFEALLKTDFSVSVFAEEKNENKKGGFTLKENKTTTAAAVWEPSFKSAFTHLSLGDSLSSWPKDPRLYLIEKKCRK